ENACALFPDASFAVGNVFEIAAPDKAYDLCFVHDLFEHLSLEGMQAAVKEVCRVTRQGLCVSFFNMDEIRDHQVRPVDDYHRHLPPPASRLRANPQPERLHLSLAPALDVGIRRNHGWTQIDTDKKYPEPRHSRVRSGAPHG